MGKFKCKLGLALTTCTALLLQAQAETQESCNSEDLFWDATEDACRTCTRCNVGMQSTAKNCGNGDGSQGICEACMSEYYQDEQHTKASCKRCIQCDRDAGLELRSCTAGQNRECGCQIGFGLNPHVANTCIKCDIWEGDPLEGCDRTTTTEKSNIAPSTGHPQASHPENIQISPYTDLQQDDAHDDQSLSDAAIISISVVFAVVLMLLIVGGAALAVYYLCCLKRPRNLPPVKMNNADSAHQLTDTNGNRSIASIKEVIDLQTSALATSTPVPSLHVNLPEEAKPLMNGDDTNPSNSIPNYIKQMNGTAPCARLAPTLHLLEKWTLQGTPESTPKPSPVFQRSLSAPCGDKTCYSDQSFTPRSSIVEEEEHQSLALSEKTRKGAMQCQIQLKTQKLQEDKQKARSIGASHSLSDFIQDFNITRTLSQMLEIHDDSIKSDWRHLAAEWGYSHSSILALKEASKRCNNAGLALLFEKDNAEKYGVRNLEHLLDGLEKIKREDGVQYLAQYLLRKCDETTL